MSIQMTITDAIVADSKLHLTVHSTNTDRPGDLARLQASFALTNTVEEIVAELNNAATLLWIAKASPTWTV